MWSAWHRPQSRLTRVARLTRLEEPQVQVIRELLRFICGQLLLRCQVAFVPNEELVDTVRDMLVDLVHPILHVVERLLARRVVDDDDDDDVIPVWFITYPGILN